MIKPSITFEESGGSQAESVPAAYALLWTMSLAMEQVYKRDWDKRGEIAFYRQIQDRTGSLPAELRVTLEWLSFQAGGWWVWLDEAEAEGPSFVSTANWNPYFQSRSSRG